MRRFAVAILYCVCFQVVALVLLSVIRMVTVVAVSDMFVSETATVGMFVRTFAIGLWMDSIVVSHISFWALCGFMLFAVFCPCLMRYGYGLMSVMCSGLLSAVSVLHIANIPHYMEFGRPMDVSAFAWLENGDEVWKLILTDWNNYLLLAVAVVVVWMVCVAGWRVSFRFWKLGETPGRVSILTRLCIIVVYLLVGTLFVRGMSGRIVGHAVKTSEANHCRDLLMNNCAQSPAFYLLSSLEQVSEIDKRILSEDELQSYMQEFLPDADISDPFRHVVEPSSTVRVSADRPNVVVIYLEGLSTHYMSSFGNKSNLTPFLDSLYSSSFHFSRCYSTGFKTRQGILGGLYGWPSFSDQCILRQDHVAVFGGLPEFMRQQGYETTFYMSHEPNFDGLARFLPANGFDNYYCESDYPADKIVNIWGVPDDYLLQFAADRITEKCSQGRPTFSVLLTISNHLPYVVPKHYAPRTDRLVTQVVEYADWSLRQFFEKARRQSWYSNTLFVLVGDHGRIMEPQECEVPDMQNHVPLMFVGPGLPKTENSAIVSQMDIMALTTAMLGLQCTVSNLSHNVIDNPRKMVIYTTFEYLVCRQDDRLTAIRYSDGSTLNWTVAPDGRCTEAEADSVFGCMQRAAKLEHQLYLDQASRKLKNQH